jgi:valyl-tRNA synthetase
MNVLQQVLYAVRNIRGEMRITPGVAASILLVTPDEAVRKLLNDHANFFTTLTNVKSLSVKETAEAPAFAATAVAAGVTVSVELPEELRGQERDRLQKEVEKLEKE